MALLPDVAVAVAAVALRADAAGSLTRQLIMHRHVAGCLVAATADATATVADVARLLPASNIFIVAFGGHF
ncbi:hypothetical protein ACLKA7_011040 [Drosophila subpalustris]